MNGAVLLATDGAVGLAAEASARTVVTTPDLFAAGRAAQARTGTGPAIYLAVTAGAFDEDPFSLAAEGGAAGIWLTRCLARADLERAGMRLAVAEARAGLREGTLKVVASIGTPAGVLALPAMAAGSERLAGFALNEGALRLELGLQAASPAPPACLQARAMLILAAGSARVPAIDAITDGAAIRQVEAAARTARQEGFAGKLAASTDQVPPIERAFA